MKNKREMTAHIVEVQLHPEMVNDFKHFKQQLGHGDMPLKDFMVILLLTANFLLSNKDETYREVLTKLCDELKEHQKRN